MARLFGLIGNRPDLAACVLRLEAEALRARRRTSSLGWGLGFYQGDEVLMRRRPLDEHDVVDLAHQAADVHSDIIIGHVRAPSIGGVRAENSHPFRYRQWLFAQTGTLQCFDSLRERLLSNVPDFLRGNIRGETDAEIVFHVFLSFMHDTGQLDDASVSPTVVSEALRASLGVVDSMAAEVLSEPGRVNVVVTNGELLAAVRKNDAESARMYLARFDGKGDAETIIGDDVELRRRAPELARMHFALVASDTDEELRGRWDPVSVGSIVTATRAEPPQIEAL
jgi:glutamine amidotransferase